MEESCGSTVSKSFSVAFTLIELIVVIIIVGILAAVGINQYSTMVEKGRMAEAKARIGTIRNLAYQYYLEKGTNLNITNADGGVDNLCKSTDFFRYRVWPWSTLFYICASRCTSGGKTPNASSAYAVAMSFTPGTGQTGWWTASSGDAATCYSSPGQ